MKPANKTLLRARAARVVSDLYHNATPNYSRELYGRTDDAFESWFRDVAEWEIDYLGSGGAYGSDYAKTLAAPCNAGKYQSAAARARYVAKGMRAMREEREDCGALTGWRVLELAAGNKRLRRVLSKMCGKTGGKYHDWRELRRNNSHWERITEYGELYQHGRGGRTLAPAQLYSDRGRAKVDVDELSTGALVNLIMVVESFNAYVTAWCNGVPELWRGHCAEEDAELRAEVKARVRAKIRETRERHYWEARGVMTEGARC